MDPRGTKIIIALLVILLAAQYSFYGKGISLKRHEILHIQKHDPTFSPDKYFVEVRYMRFICESLIIGFLFFIILQRTTNKVVSLFLITGGVMAISMAILDCYVFMPDLVKIKLISIPYYCIMRNVLLVLIIGFIQWIRSGTFSKR